MYIYIYRHKNTYLVHWRGHTLQSTIRIESNRSCPLPAATTAASVDFPMSISHYRFQPVDFPVDFQVGLKVDFQHWKYDWVSPHMWVRHIMNMNVSHI